MSLVNNYISSETLNQKNPSVLDCIMAPMREGERNLDRAILTEKIARHKDLIPRSLGERIKLTLSGLVLYTPIIGHIAYIALDVACTTTPKMTKEQKAKIVITECKKALKERKAEETEGVFREAGNIKRLNDWLKQIQNSETLTPEAVQKLYQESTSVHDIARSISKVLSDPNLIFFSLDDLNALQDTSLAEMKKVIDKLPAEKRELLKELFQFLKEFSQHSEKTLMASGNLAVCFGPNIFKLPLALTTHANQFRANSVTQKLIENATELFA